MSSLLEDNSEELLMERLEFFIKNNPGLLLHFLLKTSNKKLAIYVIENLENLENAENLDLDSLFLEDIDLEIFKVLESSLESSLEKSFKNFVSNFLYNNLCQDNNDVVDYITSKYHNIKMGSGPNFLLNLMSQARTLGKVLSVFPNFFDNIKRWGIICDLECAKEFRLVGKLHQVYPPSLLKENEGMEFIKNCQHEMDVGGFLNKTLPKGADYEGHLSVLYNIMEPNFVIEYSVFEEYVDFYKKVNHIFPPYFEKLIARYQI